MYFAILQLTEAQEAVRNELLRLDNARERAVEQVNQTISEVNTMVETRRQELINAVSQAAQEKRKVLEEQLTIIEGEKSKVIAPLFIRGYEISRNVWKFLQNVLLWLPEIPLFL